MSGYTLPLYNVPVYANLAAFPSGNTVTPIPTMAIAQDTDNAYVFSINNNAWLLASNPNKQAYKTTATAAGTTTLTDNSAGIQYFTGSTTQTVVLPVTSTLYLGQSFQVVNESTGVVTVQSSGANTVLAMVAGSNAVFTCTALTGTTAASWNVTFAQGQYYENNCATGSAVSITSGAVTDIDSGGGTPVGIILPAGVYDIGLVCNFVAPASTSITKLSAWVGTASGNVTTGQDLTRNYASLATAANVMVGTQSLVTPSYRVTIASQTTYFLKATATFTASTLTAYGNLRATRIY